MTLGYTDTPFISGDAYRVHDQARPQPRVVSPGTASTENTPGQAPSDAEVLFDGTDLSAWVNVQDGSPASWNVRDGYMEVVPQTGDIQSVSQLGDCQLHLEFASPQEVKSESQGRGNSGIFLMGCYEVQVLDCYQNPTYADGTVGGIYGQFPPLVNPSRPPGEWQTFDIIWLGPRFCDCKLVRPAVITVFLNGILLHHHKPLLGPTQHRTTTKYQAHAHTGPLRLQDHGDLVRFRNIWQRPLTDYDDA